MWGKRTFAALSLALPVLSLAACEDVIAERNHPHHFMRNMADTGELFDGFRPFANPEIDKVCILWEQDISRFHRQIDGYFSTYELIVYVVSKGPNDHLFLMDPGFVATSLESDYCTDNPAEVVVERDPAGKFKLTVKK